MNRSGNRQQKQSKKRKGKKLPADAKPCGKCHGPPLRKNVRNSVREKRSDIEMLQDKTSLCLQPKTDLCVDQDYSQGRPSNQVLVLKKY